jgi:hypothetical protein
MRQLLFSDACRRAAVVCACCVLFVGVEREKPGATETLESLFAGHGRVAMAQQPPQTAGLIVQFSDGTVRTSCVNLGSGPMTGLDLLHRAGFAPIAEVTALGSTVCAISGDGCAFPAERCWCQCEDLVASCNYWAYHTLENGAWRYSNIGAAARTVSAGDVDGWAWGAGRSGAGAAPPARTHTEICAPEELASPTPEPNDPPSPTEFPTRTAALPERSPITPRSPTTPDHSTETPQPRASERRATDVAAARSGQEASTAPALQSRGIDATLAARLDDLATALAGTPTPTRSSATGGSTAAATEQHSATDRPAIRRIDGGASDPPTPADTNEQRPATGRSDSPPVGYATLALMLAALAAAAWFVAGRAPGQ